MGYTIPIGPYHPALEEPIHAKLYTEGEIIQEAEVFVGYNHRGIEKLASEKNPIQTLVLVERVCGICSHSHPFTYAMACEHIAEMDIPKRGQYIRVVMAELERLHSHFLWLGIACHIVGHDSLFMSIWDKREIIMNLLEEISGNRVNYGMITIGGARRDISDAQRKRILSELDKLEKETLYLRDLMVQDRSIARRTQNVGVLPYDDAVRMGAVGPHARASGMDIDIRRDAPYSSYDDFKFDVPVIESGDVYARVVVRVLESLESINIIRQAIDMLPEGKINNGNKIIKIPVGEMIARHEAPRGQLVHKVVSNGGALNQRVSIHVPTFKNAPTIPFMLRGNSIADAGLIIASIDPCFSCLDR